MELRGSRALRLCPKSGHGFGCLLIGGGSPDEKLEALKIGWGERGDGGSCVRAVGDFYLPVFFAWWLGSIMLVVST